MAYFKRGNLRRRCGCHICVGFMADSVPEYYNLRSYYGFEREKEILSIPRLIVFCAYVANYLSHKQFAQFNHHLIVLL